MPEREIGTVRGIFRYPIKSMLGEALDATALDRDGIPGDRAWGVRDEARGDFYTGKRAAGLMSCGAAYADPTQADVAGAVPEIRLPDGSRLAAAYLGLLPPDRASGRLCWNCDGCSARVRT